MAPPGRKRKKVKSELSEDPSITQPEMPQRLSESSESPDHKPIGAMDVYDADVINNFLELLPAVNHAYRNIAVIPAFENIGHLLSYDSTFTSTFMTDIFNREQFVAWKKQFELQSGTQFTVDTTATVKSKRVLFKQQLSCVHNVYHGKFGYGKHTGCPTRMTVRINGLQKTRRRNRKAPNIDPEYPCEISLIWNHNHTIASVDMLKLKNVCPHVDRKLETLYKNGHTVTTALQCIKMEIEDSLEEGGNLEMALANRSLCPDYQHCHYIFHRLFSKNHCVRNDNELLSHFIKTLNDTIGEDSVSFEKHESYAIVGICTPFMKRVHTHVQESAELVFVDSSGGLDRKGFRTFFFTTRSKAGAVPLAVGITTSGSVEVLTKLFYLVQRVMPDSAFGNRGRDVGPHVFMTEDSALEQSALSNVWPTSTQYLCQFQVLQSQWHWLVLADHRISPVDQPPLFEMVKNLVFSHTEDELYNAYEMYLSSPWIEKYPNFRVQISSLIDKRTKWCSAYREETFVHRNDIDNYAEASMRILKDMLFQRTYKFNQVQMIDFITLHLSAYYERRLLDYAHNRPIRPLRIEQPSYADDQILVLSDDVCEIDSRDETNTTYTVNTAVCVCSCRNGLTGNFCQHIYYLHSRTNSYDTISHLSDDRKIMYLVACGKLPDSSLLHEPTEENVDGYDETTFNSECPTSEVPAETEKPKHIDIDEQLRAAHATFTEMLTSKMLLHAGRETPDEMLKAYNTAIATLGEMSTASEASSALYTFGRYADEGVSLLKRRRLGNIRI